jgi:hypothetical protein
LCRQKAARSSYSGSFMELIAAVTTAANLL